MSLKVLLHTIDQNKNVFYDNVKDYSYSHSTGVLTLTNAAVLPATGTVTVTIDTVATGTTRVEIFPAVTNFPGNSANTPSG
jgi:hypothetical protein